MKCKHEWLDITTKDGRKALICSKCSKKVHKGQLTNKISADISASITLPIAREQIDMPHYNGEETVIVKVYKDDLIKELYKGLNLSINNFNKG
ncbi:hypothetical protein [Senegalia massiliensis]|uniref:Uncharacterized protein n=1 Tax=Senegalia massiliensis TaxID=1720316 RepID=A0A845R0L0_9CLOT|nr:hypothetical protein [Senegalia massiliensis]NBI08235.1 hypothetical protein [Senegalia massiliensis]